MSIVDFKRSADIPIVGQPIAVLGYTAVVSVQCRCAQTGYVSLVITQGQSGCGAGISQCPSCQRQYHIAHVQVGPDGLLQFGIAMGDVPAVIQTN